MRISIITCVRNQNIDLFQECAASVAGLEGDIEWIVIDDGSTPVSAAEHSIVVSSARSGLKTCFIQLDRNVGLSGARNVGLAKATGAWIIALDSDDRLTPGVTHELLRLPASIALACFQADYLREDGVEHRAVGYFERLFRLHGGTPLDPFLWYDFYYHGIIARRDVLMAIGGYKETLRVGEDQDILLRILEAVSLEQVAFVHSVGYEYRCNPSGICRLRWPEVLRNYTTTMLDGARRRGAPFVECRYGGTENIDGSSVDYYEYLSEGGSWVNWHSLQVTPNVLSDSYL